MVKKRMKKIVKKRTSNNDRVVTRTRTSESSLLEEPRSELVLVSF